VPEAKPQYVLLSVDPGELTIVKMAIGSGVHEDPYRHVTEYWHHGERLRRDDPYEQAIQQGKGGSDGTR
jgi:hypothetical protein